MRIQKSKSQATRGIVTLKIRFWNRNRNRTWIRFLSERSEPRLSENMNDTRSILQLRMNIKIVCKDNFKYEVQERAASNAVHSSSWLRSTGALTSSSWSRFPSFSSSSISSIGWPSSCNTVSKLSSTWGSLPPLTPRSCGELLNNACVCYTTFITNEC